MQEKVTKKTNKGLVIGLVALLVVALAFGIIWFCTRPDTTAGSKNINVTVVYSDETSKDFPISTDEEYLGRAIVDSGLVVDDQQEYGLYITTVDGVTADDTKQEWWCLTKGGEMVMTGADETPIADGDSFELTLTVGW